MTIEKTTYGLLIETDLKYGSRYISAKAVGRKEGEDHPINPRTDSWDEPALELDGLGLYGHIYKSHDGFRSVIGDEPRYQDIYAVDLRKAKRMAKTLTKVSARIEKDAAMGAVEIFHSLAKAIKAEFVVRRIGAATPVGWYRDSEWNWMTVSEGKRAFKNLIDEAIEADKAVAA